MTSMERRRRELESMLQRCKAMGTLDQYTDTMLELADVLLSLDRAELALQWVDQAERRRYTTDTSRCGFGPMHITCWRSMQRHTRSTETYQTSNLGTGVLHIWPEYVPIT